LICPQKQGSLADGKGRVDANADQPWLLELRVRPKTVFLIPRPPEADDRVSQVDEGQVVASINFKANLQTAE
jgi:hypothetical protein